MKNVLSKICKTIQGPIIVLAIFAAIGSGGWAIGRTGNLEQLKELKQQHQQQIDILKGQLSEAREAVARTEDLLTASRAALQRASDAIGRSQELAKELGNELGTISTGSSAIDDIIVAIRRDVEGITRELSTIQTTDD